MNELNVIGKITKDVSLKTSANGKNYCFLTVAVRRAFSQNNETDFINFIAFGKQAEIIANFTEKGSNIGLNATLQTETKKEGDQFFNTYQGVVQKITLIDKKGSNSPKNNQNNKTIGEEDLDSFFAPKQEKKEVSIDLGNTEKAFDELDSFFKNYQ